MNKYIEIRDIKRGGGKYPKLIDEGFTELLRQPAAEPHRKNSECRRSESKRADKTDEYETDNRKRSLQDLELQELRKLVSECEHCRSRLPEFTTKKPKYQFNRNNEVQTQTPCDTTLFKMLEEKIEEIGRHSRQTNKELKKMEETVRLKDDELDEMEERLTEVFYKVSEDIFLFERVNIEYSHMKTLASLCPEVPSFLKCLALDQMIHTGSCG